MSTYGRMPPPLREPVVPDRATIAMSWRDQEAAQKAAENVAAVSRAADCIHNVGKLRNLIRTVEEHIRAGSLCDHGKRHAQTVAALLRHLAGEPAGFDPNAPQWWERESKAEPFRR